MTLVLDSSALFSMQDLPGEDCVTVPGVWDELRRHKDPRAAYWGGLLRTASPSDEALAVVRGAAEDSGDQGRISSTDSELLALAWELKAPLLTDDYSMQNVARAIGVRCIAVGAEGIRKVWRWRYRCQGCGRSEESDLGDCPVCGSRMRSVRKR